MMELTGGVQASASGGGDAGTLSERRCWASGRIWGWAKWSPPAFYSFLYFFQFLFLISDLNQFLSKT
jgi:hypothetical protein